VFDAVYFAKVLSALADANSPFSIAVGLTGAGDSPAGNTINEGIVTK